ESRPDYKDWQKEHQSAGEPSINLCNTMFSRRVIISFSSSIICILFHGVVLP
ncbi:13306_t:CDS:2, partial [Dentiscutata heterogama]